MIKYLLVPAYGIGLATQRRERIEKGRLVLGGKTSRLVRDPSADAGNLFVHRVSSDNRVRCLTRDLVNKAGAIWCFVPLRCSEIPLGSLLLMREYLTTILCLKMNVPCWTSGSFHWGTRITINIEEFIEIHPFVDKFEDIAVEKNRFAFVNGINKLKLKRVEG